MPARSRPHRCVRSCRFHRLERPGLGTSFVSGLSANLVIGAKTALRGSCIHSLLPRRIARTATGRRRILPVGSLAGFDPLDCRFHRVRVCPYSRVDATRWVAEGPTVLRGHIADGCAPFRHRRMGPSDHGRRHPVPRVGLGRACVNGGRPRDYVDTMLASCGLRLRRPMAWTGCIGDRPGRLAQKLASSRPAAR